MLMRRGQPKSCTYTHMPNDIFRAFLSTSVRVVLSGVGHSGEQRATSQELARNAACHSAKSAAAIQQGMLEFQHLFQPVLQDMTKGICCHFVAVSTTPSLEFSNRHQATRSTAWLFSGPTSQ